MASQQAGNRSEMGPPGGAGGPGAPPLGHLPHRRKMIIMGAALLAMFVAAVNQTLVTTAIPRIVADLEGFDYLSWIFTAYMLTATTSSPVWGKLSDRWGRKVFLISGIIIFIVTSAGAGASQNILQLIIWRGIQGFGGGMLMSCGFTVIADLFTPRERGRYSGLLSGVFGVSSIIGPLLGGFLTDTLSWRWTFYANIPVALLALPILFRILPTVRQPARGGVDLIGASVLTLAVVPLLLAFVWAGGEYAWGSPMIIGLMVFSALMALLFVAVEAWVADPILPLHLFRNEIYSITSVITVLQGFGMYGAITFVPFLAQGVIGLSATGSGTVTSPMMVSMVLASATSGAIYSRGGAFKPLILTGMVVITLGLFGLATLSAGTTPAMVIALMLVIGFGIGFALPVLTVMVQNAVPVQFLGVVTSNMQFYRSIGGTISVAVMGTVVTSRLDAGLPPPNPRLAVLPPEITARLRDPQVLTSPDISAAVHDVVARLPGGEAVFVSSLEGLRLALSGALHWAFLLGAVVSSLGLLVALFIREGSLAEAPEAQIPERPLAPATGRPAPAASSSTPTGEPVSDGVFRGEPEQAPVPAGLRGSQDGAPSLPERK